ncbi:MAG: RHS repeat-associated core domain-containing protein, partial [Clostridia bacterium]|nr:RHS repeat-associated core domain-containing protein [Clostridia bacterium]
TDILGRNKGKEISGADGKIVGEYVYYRKVGDHATNMPSAVYFGNTQSGTYVIRDNVKYEYDKSGNICKIFENGALAVRYEYDGINRLTREDNKRLGITVLFAYDNCGNIISRRQTSFTLKENVEECEFTETLYSYDGDKLLSFGNEVCEYDEIGNPTTYRGKTVAWAKGRQMTAYDGITFAYDGQGRRIAKNSITYTYDGSGRLIASSNGLEYLYDNTGVFAVKNGESTYFYRKDAQGNIIALLDNDGDVVVEYKYDAWGNHAVLDANGADITDVNHIGVLNPFRYRGYFYDVETGLYYLKSRYYDPEIGRFITIDDISYIDPETINGLNLYAYCGNNPVMRMDSQGTNWWTDFWNGVGNWFADNWVKITIGAAFIVGGAVVTFFTAGMGTAGLLAAGSALLASVKAVGISMAVSAGIGTVVGGITGGWEGALQGFSNGLADGFMWGGIFAGSAQILGGMSKLLASRNVNFSDNFNWLFGNRNSQSTTLLRVNKAGKQLFRIDADITHLWHLHYGATSALMRLHRTGIALFSYLGIVNGVKGVFGGF